MKGCVTSVQQPHWRSKKLKSKRRSLNRLSPFYSKAATKYHFQLFMVLEILR